MRVKFCWLIPLSFFSVFLFAQSVADAAREDRAARGMPAATTRTGASPAKTAAASVETSTNGAADSAAPESGVVENGRYASKYFSLMYSVPEGWTPGLPGPPPSESGYYVLSSFRPGSAFKGRSKGTILIAAWDLFFVPRPAANAMELLKDMKATLPEIYKSDAPLAEIKIGGHAFAQFDYTAVAAPLHWRVLATEIRCHMVEFVLTSGDTRLLDNLVQAMNTMKLPWGAEATGGTGGGESPRCIKDYATGANVMHRVEPVMAGPRYTSVPVRFFVGVDGKVKNIHVIHGDPEQARSVQAALAQWVFKPYLRSGAPEEVETGILFKFPPDGVKLPPAPEKY